MTDKQRILAEMDLLIQQLLFIETAERMSNPIQEEPVSEDLEEAVNAYIGYAPEVGEDSSIYGKRQAFKAGAKWQINKMIEDAIETSVMDAFGIGLHIEVKLEPNKYNFGDKVKLIIIKENER